MYGVKLANRIMYVCPRVRMLGCSNDCYSRWLPAIVDNELFSVPSHNAPSAALLL